MSGTSRRVLTASLALCLGVVSLISSSVNAGTVSFTNITQSTQSPGDPPNLYGVPNLSTPNVLSFPAPASFSSTAIGGGATSLDLTDGFLSFMGVAAPGSWATNLGWNESGTWTLFAAGPATPVTSVHNRILGFITINEVNGVPVAIPPVAVSAPNVDFNIIANTPPDSNFWSNGFGFNFVPYGKVTKFTVAIDNRLISSSEPGTIAFIDKKDITIHVGTGMVPEPATAMLGLVALCGMGLARRNRG